jgi:2-deoxy-D-gluconate 3-dehydrogenase
MDTGLRGKRALVTGGGTGIGRSIALELAKEGVHVCVASRNPDPKTIGEIEALGVRALRLCTDVSKEEQVVKMVKETIEGLGGLDLYVNNAAAHWDEPVTKVTTEGWQNSLDTNLSACVWACREVARLFISQGYGSILIVGSTCMHTPLYKETSYRVSKTGLKAYMEVLAVELAPFGIRVNMLTPGYFPTRVSAHLARDRSKEKTVLDTIPLRRAGRLGKDIGPAAVFLLSDAVSAYTTGSEIVVDGGIRLRPLPYYSDEEIRQMNL